MEMDGENGILGILRDEPTQRSKPRFCLVKYSCGHSYKQPIQNVGYVDVPCLALVTVELACGHVYENETYCYENPRAFMCRACGCFQRVLQILRGKGNNSSAGNDNDLGNMKPAVPVPVPIQQVALGMNDPSDDAGEKQDELMDLGIDIETDNLGPEENIVSEQQQVLPFPFTPAQPEPSTSAVQPPEQEAPNVDSVENVQVMDVAGEQRKRRREDTANSGGDQDDEPPFKWFGF